MKHFVIGLLLCGLPDFVAAAENALFAELTGRGIGSIAGHSVVLPVPTLADGLSPADQQRAIGGIIEGHHSLDNFLRKSVVSPFMLKMTPVESTASSDEQPWRVDLWFVAYADLNKISDEQFLKRQFESEVDASGNAASSRLVALTDADLAKRNIVPAEGQRFFAGTTDLFDRVRLSATLQAWQTRTPESVLVAMQLDPRFESDAQYPDRWETLKRDDSNRLQVGPPQAYRGAGGYVKATRLAEPAGAVLIEYHLVFAEPRAWFDGANFLRSKLPLVCQDGVRKFRRRATEP